MIITKEVKLQWTNNNKKYYIEKGYVFTNISDVISIKLDDLRRSEKVDIQVSCDNCGREYQIKNRTYISKYNNKKSTTYCKACLNRNLKDKREIICGIYLITNKINNKFYIGQSVDIYSRWQSYKSFWKDESKTEPILQAMRKYGFDNFKFEILCKCDKKDLNKMENNYIKEYSSCMLYNNSNGYNIYEGGASNNIQGRKPRKVLCINTGEIFISAKEAGLKYCISDSTIRRCCSGSMNTAYNMEWKYASEENELDKIKNKIDEYRNEIPEDLYSIINNYIQVNNIKKSPTTKIAIKVICNETQEIFESIDKTGMSLGLSGSGIRRHLRGEQERVKSKIDGEYYTFKKL